MESIAPSELRRRVACRIREWRVDAERALETETSVIVFGHRDGDAVVAKIVRSPGEEWRSGLVTQAFGGRGMVRVYEYGDGAVLLECLSPGNSLVQMSLDGRDELATEILADVIGRMAPPPRIGADIPTVDDWAKALERYVMSGDERIPRDLLDVARETYSFLSRSQGQTRLLHGDLHHCNVLFDVRRGWVAIDPKGVIGELEYEVGATLRNPWERPEAFTTAAAITRRIDCFGRKLGLDTERTLAWAFVQAVLAAVWCVEDGFGVEPNNPALMLATTIRPMLSVA